MNKLTLAGLLAGVVVTACGVAYMTADKPQEVPTQEVWTAETINAELGNAAQDGVLQCALTPMAISRRKYCRLAQPAVS